MRYLIPSCPDNNLVGLLSATIRIFCNKKVYQVLLFADQISSMKVMKAALEFSSKHFQVVNSTLLLNRQSMECRLWPPCPP